jgi:hypothetical protein
MRESAPTVETRESEAAKRLITCILTAKPSSLRLLLDREGIVELDFPDDDTNTDDDHSQNTPIEVTIRHASSHPPGFEGPRPVTPTPLFSDAGSVGSETIVSSVFPPDPFARRRLSDPSNVPSPQNLHPSYPLQESALSPQPTTPRTPRTPKDSAIPNDPGYVDLLSKVIRIARVAGLPRKGLSNVSAIRQDLPGSDETDTVGDYFRLPRAGGTNRKALMGAAGELYVSFLESCAAEPV